ncbi:MAG TPA: tripartite tricarboxylate transporter substrate binding protein [Burkholderiales bacterium]|nr:tripartite tricarboxylate transporter substrate binding protein [Burkholderiales bacterium]
MRILLAALACAAALFPAGASAQYPARPVHLVVGFPAGGPADIFGRTFAQALGTGLGQPVVVENKSGVGGVLGIDAVAKSAPDGYTLGFNNQGSVAMAPYALTKMPFNPNKDLALITAVVKVPEVVVVNPSLPVKSLAELIAYAKANPGKIAFGSAGAGGITHLACELLKSEAKIDVLHVPYKGAAPAVSDLLGGQVQMGIFDVPVVLPHIKSGKFRALALTSAKRAPSLPDVPTTAEAGYPRVISDNWYGLVAPAGTPPAVLKRIHEASIAALQSPALIEQFAKVSGIPAPMTPEEYRTFLGEEQARWGAIIKAIGFKEDI